MANPRQRRKVRSSSHRPVRHSKNAKRNLKKTPTIRGPKVLQEIWDKRKTVKQNYIALGLLHTTNPCSSGGVENSLEKSSEPNAYPEEPPLLPQVLESHEQEIPEGFGRIIRDFAGAVIRIEVNEGSEVPMNSQETQVDMEQLDPVVDVELLSKWSMGGRVSNEITCNGSSVAEALGKISTPQTASTTLSFALSGVGARHPSAGEKSFLQKLVNKHGEDIDRMAQDRKLNPEQRTASQLRTALHRAGLRG